MRIYFGFFYSKNKQNKEKYYLRRKEGYMERQQEYELRKK